MPQIPQTLSKNIPRNIAGNTSDISQNISGAFPSGLSFKPKMVTKTLLSPLAARSREVLVGRFGLGADTEKRTLDAIGKNYGITRERVRQIESSALAVIRKSESFTVHTSVFEELHERLDSLGGLVAEEDLLAHLAKEKSAQNHIGLYLVLGEKFNKHKEDDYFRHRWSVDHKTAARIHNALLSLHDEISMEDLLSEEEIIARFLKKAEVAEKYKSEETARRWLAISKILGRNKMGDWGRAESPSISARGIRDYAFLVIRKHGAPMHFTEVAKTIAEVFGKKAHIATCHNELIKDPRFVLVGRGMYVLSEWGYAGGAVRDVISDILKQRAAPMTKEEIFDEVMKRREVKGNTILVNLQNPHYFQKDETGRYFVQV